MLHQKKNATKAKRSSRVARIKKTRTFADKIRLLPYIGNNVPSDKAKDWYIDPETDEIRSKFSLTEFTKRNKGSLYIVKLSTGGYKVRFSSEKTGKSAFAYGQTIEAAHRKMVDLFTLKYVL